MATKTQSPPTLKFTPTQRAAIAANPVGSTLRIILEAEHGGAPDHHNHERANEHEHDPPIEGGDGDNPDGDNGPMSMRLSYQPTDHPLKNPKTIQIDTNGMHLQAWGWKKTGHQMLSLLVTCTNLDTGASTEYLVSGVPDDVVISFEAKPGQIWEGNYYELTFSQGKLQFPAEPALDASKAIGTAGALNSVAAFRLPDEGIPVRIASITCGGMVITPQGARHRTSFRIMPWHKAKTTRVKTKNPWETAAKKRAG